MYTIVTVIFTFLMSLILGFLVLPKIIKISSEKNLYDMPDYRKVHGIPVPRLGGVAFFPIILMVVCFTMACSYIIGYKSLRGDTFILFTRYMLLITGLTILYLVGIMDDLVGVSFKMKFLAQTVCAALFPLSGLVINNLWGLFGIHHLSPWLSIPLTMFLVVYITNAINLIDGIDGLSSGLSCIAFLALGCACALEQKYVHNMLCFSALGVLLAFVYYNVFGNAEKGTKVFMGDTGSLTLGYLLSFMVIYMCKESGRSFPQGTLLIAFSTVLLPMLDIVRVVASRFRRRDPLFLPDKNHIHHKLLRTGLRIRGVLIVLLCLSAVYIAIAIGGVLAGLNYTLIFCIEIALWVIVQCTINHFIHKREGDKTKEIDQIAFGHVKGFIVPEKKE